MTPTPSTSTTSTPREPTTSAGPARFQIPVPPPPSTGPVQRIGAALALTALVVGVPALLFWLAGPPPIPTRLPTRDDLTQNIGIQQILTILVAVVWLAWLQFVLCVAVEMMSAVRHRGVPAPVPLSGPSQRLARFLVGALLLTSVVGGTVSSVVSAVSTANRPTVTVSQVQTPGSSPTADANGAGGARAPATTAATSAPQTGPPAQAPVNQDKVQKVYTVALPVGHHHDSLWEIAERHLGDGRRYQEIYELNKGHIQPDGRSLHLARLIYAGWELVMPADAVGVTVIPAAGTPATEAAPLPAPAPSLTVPVSDARAAVGHGGDELQPAPVTEQVTGVQGGDVSPLVAALSAGGILSACLLLALARLRRRNQGGLAGDGDAAESEVGLRAGADPRRARFVDAALRGLALRCGSSGAALPLVYAATADDDEVSLLISPPRADAPHPWETKDDGRRWTLHRSQLGRGAVEGPAAYPALVSLGRDEQGADVFVDLEAADGPVQVDGDPVLAGQVAAAIAVQLATSPWSDAVRVSAVGLPPGIGALASDEIDVTDDVGQVIERLETRAAKGRSDVLSGRLARQDDGAPEYAVFATGLDDASSMRVATLLAGGRHPVGVVGVGRLPGSQWWLHVDDGGTLTVPLLGLTVTAHRLSEQSVDAVAELFAAAGTPPAPTIGPGLDTVPAASSSVDDAALAVAPVRVGVLGPVSVRADGPLDPSRKALAEEIVTYLVLHPGGVHPTVLASAIWPRGVGDAVAAATVERVRDWLGSDEDGSARLRTDASGRHRLASSVACDWDAFCSLVDRAKSATSPTAEADLLRRALHLVRGPVLDGHEENRYSWLARTGVERSVTSGVVHVAHRLVELSRSGSDPDGAGAAAEAGLRLARDAQLLWRDVLEIEHDRGGVEAVRAAEAEMRMSLDDAAIPVEAETEALVEHLAGGPDPAAHAHA